MPGLPGLGRSEQGRADVTAAATTGADTKQTAVPRVYDRRERALALRITREHPGWVVLWGVSSRRYWAFPIDVAIPRGTILSATRPRDVIAAIHQAGLAAAPGPPSHVPVSPRPPATRSS